jgi:hypothetical protein
MVESTDIISKASATVVKTSTRRTGGLSPGAPETPSVPRASCGIFIFPMSYAFNALLTRETMLGVPSHPLWPPALAAQRSQHRRQVKKKRPSE